MIQSIELTTGRGAAPASSGCACCGPATAAAPAPAAATAGGAVSSTYAVTGMTCGHCVGAVRDELTGLADVHDVQVDLVPGGTSTVTVTAGRVLDRAVVAAAVGEAGYRLLPPA
ncbi:heavy-metal-associated domain-containing protein [Kineococcus sp. SYSU DK018]|uniref:heavy-metal-associated domain-containing protein n=1 Tax=Kineococcus sp. SYSU DK018 TaxID=3383139 RepID=UPI003D7F12C3